MKKEGGSAVGVLVFLFFCCCVPGGIIAYCVKKKQDEKKVAQGVVDFEGGVQGNNVEMAQPQTYPGSVQKQEDDVQREDILEEPVRHEPQDQSEDLESNYISPKED